MSGVLGLAVLGAAGCAGPAGASPSTSEQVGPAVVLNAPADAGAAKQPSSKATSKAKDTKSKAGATTAISAITPDDDGATKKVPAAKPKPAKDSPNSAPTAKTAKSAKTAPSANTP